MNYDRYPGQWSGRDSTPKVIPPAPSSPRGILGVTREATWPQIHAAYRMLVKENHPDNGGDSEKMAAINGAYTALRKLLVK